MANLSCSNCGAALEIENQFVRTVTCDFCGSTYMLSGSEDLNPAGQSASLADYPSRLDVGMRGSVQGRAFRVMGRVRYMYDGGFWEEWQVAWDDGAPPDWLEEDEGYWILYKKQRIKSAVPDYDSVKVGGTVQINGQDVFVTEKRQAKMVGSRGQFVSTLPMTNTFSYIQGAANGQSISITYWGDELELSVGDELDFNEVKIES